MAEHVEANAPSVGSVDGFIIAFCNQVQLRVCDDVELYLALACEQFGGRAMLPVIQLTEEWYTIALNTMGELKQITPVVNSILRDIATIRRQTFNHRLVF